MNEQINQTVPEVSGQQAPVDNNQVVDNIVEQLNTQTIDNAVNETLQQGQIQFTPQHDQTQPIQTVPVEDFNKMSNEVQELKGAISSLVEHIKTTQEVQNEKKLDTGLSNDNIKENDKSFNVDDIDKVIGDQVASKVGELNQQIEAMKISTIKQSHGLSDKDFDFVQTVAQKSNIDIVNNPVGLQNILKTIEANNKVVIGKSAENTSNEAEDKLNKMSETLKQLTNGRL